MREVLKGMSLGNLLGLWVHDRRVSLSYITLGLYCTNDMSGVNSVLFNTNAGNRDMRMH